MIKSLLKILGYVVLSLVGLGVLLVVLLLLPPVRGRILAEIVVRVDRTLPGEIAVEKATWPSLGTIEAFQLRWTAAEDTLVSVDRLRVSVDLSNLLRRDLCATEILLDEADVDYPAMRLTFPARAPEQDISPKKARGTGFPRGGSIPGFPSLAAKRVAISARSIRISPSLSLEDVRLSGTLDLAHGHDPRIVLERLAIRGPQNGWQLDSLALDVDASDWTMSGVGAGRLQPGYPVFLSLATTGTDEGRLILTAEGGKSPPGAVGVELDVQLERGDAGIEAMSFQANVLTPGTGELSQFRMLKTSLEGMPELEGLSLSSSGTVRIQPELSAELGLTVHPSVWVTGGGAAVSYTDADLVVDTVWVGLPDLHVGARGRLEKDQVVAAGGVRARGTRWLEVLKPGTVPLDSLTADLGVRLEGPRAVPDLEVTLGATAVRQGFRMDRLEASAEVPGDRKRPAFARLTARARDFTLSAAAEVLRDGDLEIHLEPILVEETARARHSASSRHSTPGTVRLGSEDGSITVKNVQALGALGNVRLDGEIYRNQKSSFRANWAAPEPPVALTKVLDLDPAPLDSLRAHWKGEGPFLIALSGTMDPTGASRDLNVDATLRLPGPRVLAPLLPSESRVDDLGPIAGKLLAAASVGESGRTFDARLDLGQTAWLDTAEVIVTGHGRRVQFDRVALAGEGVRIGAEGSFDEGAWDVRSSVDVPNAAFLGRFVPRRELDLAVRAQGEFQGTFDAPNLTGSMEGRVRDLSYEIPRLEGDARWSPENLILAAKAPEGVRAGKIRLDSLYVGYEAGTSGDLFPGTLTVKADGKEVGTLQRLRVDKPEGWTVSGDTLVLHLQGRDLRTTRPFRLEILPKGGGIVLDKLDLSGALGDLNAHGFAGPDSSRFTADLTFRFPGEPPLERLPADLWPKAMEIQLRANGTDAVEASARIAGITLGNRRGLDVGMTLVGSSSGITAALEMIDERVAILDAAFEVPGAVRIYPPGATFHDGPVSGDMTLVAFPVPTELAVSRPREALARTAQLDARLSLSGTTREPSAFAGGRMSFPDWPKMSVYGIPFEVHVASDSVDVGTRAGLLASFALDRLQQRLLTGMISVPVNWSLLPGEPVTRTVDSLDVRIESGDLILSEFDPFLPPDMGLEGTCRIRFSARGPVEDPALDGRLAMSKVKASLADGTRIAGKADLSFGGTKRLPSVSGQIEIQNGVIRVPDPPKNLHPVHGKAVLWEPDALESGQETLATDPASTIPRDPDPSGRPRMDLNINVNIPSGLWIRGQGLNVELAGELDVVQKGEMPTVTGTLSAARGHLAFLGRTFDVDRGQAVFYGDDEVNPSLDLVLSSNVEGTLVRILVQGTVQKPEILLTSEPEMTEGDIMSTLLFGRPLDELNSDQAALVQRRASDIAAAFGAAQMEARIARQLGVDMVSIQWGSGPERRRSVTFGKYISRRVLLRYEQALEEWGSFFVNLEYFLTQSFRLETLMGRQSQSAIGVNWTKDY